MASGRILVRRALVRVMGFTPLREPGGVIRILKISPTSPRPVRTRIFVVTSSVSTSIGSTTFALQHRHPNESTGPPFRSCILCFSPQLDNFGEKNVYTETLWLFAVDSNFGTAAATPDSRWVTFWQSFCDPAPDRY